MSNFNLFVSIVVLLLISTSVEVSAIRIENISTKSLKVKEIFRSLMKLKTFQSMRIVPTGPNPLHNVTSPDSQNTPNTFTTLKPNATKS